MIAGTIPARVQPRQASDRNPRRFSFTATFREEAERGTPDAQGQRDDAWTRWVMGIANKGAACA